MTGTQPPVDASREPEPLSESLVDCKLCGCLHRKDVACPWGPGREREALA